jgi:hypothetical protein
MNLEEAVDGTLFITNDGGPTKLMLVGTAFFVGSTERL